MTGSDQAWAEPVLEIDEHTERGGAIGVDQEIRVLARANRLLLFEQLREHGDVGAHRVSALDGEVAESYANQPDARHLRRSSRT